MEVSLSLHLWKKCIRSFLKLENSLRFLYMQLYMHLPIYSCESEIQKISTNNNKKKFNHTREKNYNIFLVTV